MPQLAHLGLSGQTGLACWGPGALWPQLSAAFAQMPVIPGHTHTEDVAMLADAAVSPAAAWTWMTGAAQLSREPGGPGPRRTPCRPRPFLVVTVAMTPSLPSPLPHLGCGEGSSLQDEAPGSGLGAVWAPLWRQ